MDKKRPYRLGKRAASVNETKRRVLDAATAEYVINGIEKTSMQAVARRADVAPGTVLYHYPTPEDLAEAVIEAWIKDLEMPQPDLVDPEADLDERINVLVDVVFSLYERSDWTYKIYQKSPNHPSFAKGFEMWQASLGGLMLAALGDRAANAETMSVVSVLIDPGFRGTLLSRGLDEAATRGIAKRLILGWLEA